MNLKYWDCWDGSVHGTMSSVRGTTSSASGTANRSLERSNSHNLNLGNSVQFIFNWSWRHQYDQSQTRNRVGLLSEHKPASFDNDYACPTLIRNVKPGKFASTKTIWSAELWSTPRSSPRSTDNPTATSSCSNGTEPNGTMHPLHVICPCCCNIASW